MLTLRRRKWHGYSLALLLFFLLLVGGLFFVIRHRFNRVLEYVVQQESKGRYAFRADQMDVSLWHKRIIMSNASLVFLDTTNDAAHYDVLIPEIYFSIASWRELLLNKKIIIDSFSVVRPHLEIYGLKKNPAVKSKAFQPTDILTYLEQTLEHLNARSLSIRDAAFTCRETSDSPPVRGEQINLTLTNFTQVNNEDSHILGSDNVEFSMGKQDWPLDGGKQEIHFSRLSFKSSNQQVEIDSFLFRQKSGEGQGPLQISADRFFFNSRHLPAVYQKSELLIDTLYCLKPVFSVPGQEKTKPATAIASAPDIRGQLFHRVNIRFMQIVDGSLALMNQEGTGQTTVASKTNLSVYNLNLDPTQNPHLSTDSVRMNISKIRFLSKDSLFQLDIDEFAFNRNDVIFRQVLFAPSEYNHSGKKITFKAPLLILRNINMEALMRKRIQAASAELVRPEISFYDPDKENDQPRSTSLRQSAHPSSLYQTLHGLPQLIDVSGFRILDGSFRYSSERGIAVYAGGINARLLPNKFFLSDALLDIKQAIPELQLSRLNVRSGNLQLSLNDYRFDGIRQVNHISAMLISLQNGTAISGRNIFWTSLDWDAFQKSREIEIRELTLDSSSVHIKTGNASSGPKKDLPRVHLGRLNIRQAAVYLDDQHNHTRFELANSRLDQLQTEKQFLQWAQLTTDLTRLKHQGPHAAFSIDRIHFANDRESSIENFRLTSTGPGSHANFFAPAIRMKADVRSTDMHTLLLQSVRVDKASLNWYSKQTTAAHANTFRIPAGIIVSDLALDNLQLHLIRDQGKDSSTLEGNVSLTGENIQLIGNQKTIASYGALGLSLSDLQFRHGQLHADVPAISLSLKEGLVSQGARQPEVSSTVDLLWKNAAVRLRKDSATISAVNISGHFSDPAFRINHEHPLVWQQLIEKISAHGNDFHYRGKNNRASIRDFSWNSSQLSLRDFEIMPVQTREETFKTARWQNDYMEVKGRGLTVSGIRWPQAGADSALHVTRVLMDAVSLNTYRDRRVPFRHGVEKSMPTKLITALPFAVSVDSLWLQHNEVTVHEFSIATGLWSEIPLEDINGYIASIKSRHNLGDQLSVGASAQLFRNPIRWFSYQESYGDSLSYFKASVLLTHANLSRFSPLTMPMAALRIKKGNADTVSTQWEGNKYASTGNMHLIFRYLKIKLYDKKDSSRQSLLPALKTWVANLLLPAYHDKQSSIFVERDREKFVFNYWVKAQTSGFLSSLGVRSDKKYNLEYNRKAAQYGLPPVEKP